MKMNFLTAISIVGFMAGVSQSAGAASPEWTTKQNIVRIEFDANSNDAWFVGSSTWASASCPNASWVRVLGSLSGEKQIFALGMAAQMADKSVTFYGNCDATNTIFNATYIRVE